MDEKRKVWAYDVRGEYFSSDIFPSFILLQLHSSTCVAGYHNWHEFRSYWACKYGLYVVWWSLFLGPSRKDGLWHCTVTILSVIVTSQIFGTGTYCSCLPSRNKLHLTPCPNHICRPSSNHKILHLCSFMRYICFYKLSVETAIACRKETIHLLNSAAFDDAQAVVHCKCFVVGDMKNRLWINPLTLQGEDKLSACIIRISCVCNV